MSVIGNQCFIHHFDDGMEQFKTEPNVWIVVEDNNRGKYMIQNKHSPHIIRSISSWKITKL